MNRNQNMNTAARGEISVREAGRRGGTATSQTHGHEFYSEIGHKGGQRVKELIQRAEEMENRQM